jgi:hypothetical protein
MAFAEGSPVHPAYGAGHATVAGGWVTMIQAFFERFEDADGRRLRELRAPNGRAIVFVPDATGAELVKDKSTKGALPPAGGRERRGSRRAFRSRAAGARGSRSRCPG